MLNIFKLQKYLFWAFIAAAGAILFIPLLVINNILRPYILSKTIPFQILVLAILAIWIFLLAIDFKKYRPRFNWLLIALSIFILMVFLSTIFSLNFYRSFWGNAERTEGFVNILYFYVFSVALFSVLKEKPDVFRKLIFLTLVVSLFVAIFPLFQRVGLIASPLGEDLSRPSGSLGNPVFFAGYLLVHLFLGLWFLFNNSSPDKKFSPLINLFVIFIVLVDLAVFVWAQTRGSFLGLFLGILAAMIVAVFVLPPKKKILVAAILIFGLVIFALFLVFRSAIRDSAAAKEFPIIGRLASVSLNDPSTRGRLLAWQWSLNWWQKRPIFGAGQDMFYKVFDDNYSANNFNLMSERFDRAHNKYIDILVMNGALGIVSYLFLLGTIFWLISRQIKKAKNTILKIAWLAMIGLFVAYFTHNFFVFDTPANSLMFYFLMAGLMVFSFVPKKDEAVMNGPRFNYWRLIIAAVLAIVIVGPAFYYSNYKVFRVGRLVYAAAASPPQNISQIFNYYREAIQENSFISTEARKMLADYWMRILIYNRFQKSFIDGESLKNYSEVVIEQMEKGYQKEAMVDFYVYGANIYLQLSGTDGFGASDQERFVSQEDYWFSEIAKKWPKRTDLYVIYAEDLLLKKDYDRAELVDDAILKETPDFGRAIWLKAAIILAKNTDINTAFRAIEEAISAGYLSGPGDILLSIAPLLSSQNYSQMVKFLESFVARERVGLDLAMINKDAEMAKRLGKIQSILNLLIQLKINSLSAEKSPDYNQLVSYLEESLKYQPNNADYWVKLAVAYAKLRNKEKAIFAAQEAMAIDPSRYSQDAQAFIKIVQNEEWEKIY